MDTRRTIWNAALAAAGFTLIAFGVTSACSGWDTGRTWTEHNGTPDYYYYKRIQTIACRDYGYTGPIDGITGSNTERNRVRITARELNRRGGPRTAAEDDGIPGSIYWRRVQEVGRLFGYTGPIDGVPGPNTYRTEHMICGWTVNRAF